MPGRWRELAAFFLRRSKGFLRIQKDGDRPVVDQFHLHHFLEPSGFAAQAGGADFLDEILIEFARLLAAERLRQMKGACRGERRRRE